MVYLLLFFLIHGVVVPLTIVARMALWFRCVWYKSNYLVMLVPESVTGKDYFGNILTYHVLQIRIRERSKWNQYPIGLIRQESISGQISLSITNSQSD